MAITPEYLYYSVQGVYKQGVRDGEGTFWYVDGTKDSGVWRGNKLVQLEFPAYGIRFFPYSVYRPDVHRIRRKHKPKPGLLEVVIYLNIYLFIYFLRQILALSVIGVISAYLRL